MHHNFVDHLLDEWIRAHPGATYPVSKNYSDPYIVRADYTENGCVHVNPPIYNHSDLFVTSDKLGYVYEFADLTKLSSLPSAVAPTTAPTTAPSSGSAASSSNSDTLSKGEIVPLVVVPTVVVLGSIIAYLHYYIRPNLQSGSQTTATKNPMGIQL